MSLQISRRVLLSTNKKLHIDIMHRFHSVYLYILKQHITHHNFFMIMNESRKINTPRDCHFLNLFPNTVIQAVPIGDFLRRCPHTTITHSCTHTNYLQRVPSEPTSAENGSFIE